MEYYLTNKWITSGWMTNNTSSSFTVSPGPVTITSGLTANDKDFDGTTTATLSSNNVVLSGILPADVSAGVTLVTNGYLANFTNAAVGNGRSVTVSGLTLGPANSVATNYNLIQPTNLTASILSVVPYSGYVITNSGSSITSGVPSQLTITAVDTSGTTV